MRRNIEWLFPVRGRWLRYLLVSIGCCVALLLPLVLLFTAEIPIHNWNLQRFSEFLAAIQHPPGSGRVKTVKQVGNYEPTGNQCEYFVAELRSYTGSKENIRDFYRESAIRNPLNGQQQPVQLAFLESGVFSNTDALPLAYRELGPWSLPDGPAADRLYVVFVFDGGHDPGFDYRCH